MTVTSLDPAGPPADIIGEVKWGHSFQIAGAPLFFILFSAWTPVPQGLRAGAGSHILR